MLELRNRVAAVEKEEILFGVDKNVMTEPRSHDLADLGFPMQPRPLEAFGVPQPETIALLDGLAVDIPSTMYHQIPPAGTRGMLRSGSWKKCLTSVGIFKRKWLVCEMLYVGSKLGSSGGKSDRMDVNGAKLAFR